MPNTGKSERVDSMLTELDAFEEEPVFLLSNKVKEQDERRAREEAELDRSPKYGLFENNPESDMEWLDSIARMPKLNLKKKFKGSYFDESSEGNGKKKRKKGKKKDGTTDFQKEFSPEMATLKHLLLDQNEFVNSLQSSYNAMNQQKSSVRGIGKYQSDLIANITSARKTSADLVKMIIDIKKNIADLSMKERKELGLLVDADGNISDQASAFLKQLISGDRKALMGSGEVQVEDVDEDDFGSLLDESLENDDDYEERPEEVRKYLQYEGQGVSVKVILHSDGTQEFIAVDKDDNVIPDYPVPDNDTKLNINLSTKKAKDEYGVAYEIIEEH